MKQVHRRVVWLGILLLVVAALTALTALPGTTKATTFARDSHHRTPTPTPTTPTPTPTIPPLVIDTTSLPDGNVGNSYDAFVTASGGQGTPKIWSVIAGKLPDGLTMASFYGVQSTIISGTPTKLQTASFTVQVKDNTGVATQALSITIVPPPPLVITSPTPPPATVGTSYFTNLFANGGVQPYTWSITAGQLPPGLALVKGSNGGTTISGTPTARGTFTFTETVTDSTGVHASQQFSITVN
jgi:hypothetical protein